ncbi:MAG: SDR family oxidoreductase [Planctomycetota bacterium]
MGGTDGNGPLAGRVAAVTGASAGIGRAIALDLARGRAAVAVNARRAERLEALVQEIEGAGGRAVAVAGDAGEASTAVRVLDGAREAFGADPDLVVVNAGRGLSGSPITSDREIWESMFRTNVIGAAHLIREAATRMKEMTSVEGGAWLQKPRDIVILASTVGKHISPFSSMYGSTKFAIGSIAEAVRRELAPEGIRVSQISPAIVRSEFQDVAGYDPEQFGAFMESIGPVLEPEDISRLVSFMVSQPANVSLNDVVIRGTRQEYP